MRIAAIVTTWLLGLLTLTRPAAVEASERLLPAPTVDEVGWIAGCWAGTGGGTSFRESWTKASDELMLGVSYTLDAKGKLESFEFLRIAVRQGKLAYIAQPNGRPETVFDLASSSGAREAIFANPAHDFPKRVIYKATATGLLASIDDGSSQKRMEFPMTRASCEPDRR